MIVFGGFTPPASAAFESVSWPEGFVTVEDAAKRLGVSSQRVRYLLARRKLQGFRLRRGARDVWAVHKSLRRCPAKVGRPPAKRRKGGTA